MEKKERLIKSPCQILHNSWMGTRSLPKILKKLKKDFVWKSYWEWSALTTAGYHACEGTSIISWPDMWCRYEEQKVQNSIMGRGL
jgi:hypothetical protein